MVRATWTNRVLGADHLLVLSYPFGDLYVLDLTTQAATLVLSSTQAVSGSEAVPQLSSDWEGYFGPWRHSKLGDVYILTNDSDIASPPDDDSYLFLWDHDRDGIPETSELLSRNEQNAMGLNLGSAWDRSWPNKHDLAPRLRALLLILQPVVILWACNYSKLISSMPYEELLVNCWDA